MSNFSPNSDTTVLSVEQQNFSINENGTFIVPEVFVDKLVDVGFKRLPARIRVSQEAADAIAKSAKELNLPTPALSIVGDKEPASTEKTVEQLDMESQQRAGDAAAQEAADAAKQAEEVAAGEGGPGKGEADPKTE